MAAGGSSRGRGLAPDPTTSEHAFAGVKDGSLAGRHRTGRGIENEQGVAYVVAGIECRRHRRLRRTELCHDRHARRRLRSEPVYLAKRQPGLGQRCPRTDDNTPLLGIETHT